MMYFNVKINFKCVFLNLLIFQFCKFTYAITQKLFNQFHSKLPWLFIRCFKSFVGELFWFYLLEIFLSILQIGKMTKFWKNLDPYSKFSIKSNKIKNCKNPLLRSFVRLCFNDMENKFWKIFAQISCSAYVK